MKNQVKRFGMGIVLMLLSGAGQGDETVCRISPTSIDIELSSIDSDVAIFGELHGNWESPQVFLAAVCQNLLEGNRKVRIALEFPTKIQQSLDKFLQSDGDNDAVKQFLSQPFWQRTPGDGRSSIAMLTMVDELRQLRMQNPGLVSVTAIDGRLMDRPVRYSGTDRDRIMSANINNLSREFDDDIVFVLVGNLHARRTPPSDLSFLSPVGSLIQGELLSVLILPQSGESWNCQLRCQVWPVPAMNNLSALRSQVRREGSYDFVVPIERVTSAPPANQEKW